MNLRLTLSRKRREISLRLRKFSVHSHIHRDSSAFVTSQRVPSSPVSFSRYSRKSYFIYHGVYGR